MELASAECQQEGEVETTATQEMHLDENDMFAEFMCKPHSSNIETSNAHQVSKLLSLPRATINTLTY